MQSVVSRSKEKCLFDVQVGGGNRPVTATYINYITLTIQCSCSPVTCSVNLIHSGHHWACPTCPLWLDHQIASMDSGDSGHSKISIVHLCSFYSMINMMIDWQVLLWLIDICTSDWLTYVPVIDWQMYQWLIERCTSDWLTDVPVIDWQMYQHNQSAFQHDVCRFMIRSHCRIRKQPLWHGTPITLFQLFLAVHERGGYEQVTFLTDLEYGDGHMVTLGHS